MVFANHRESVEIRFSEDAFDYTNLLVRADADRFDCHNFRRFHMRIFLGYTAEQKREILTFDRSLIQGFVEKTSGVI